jgi:hypothetical protein
MNRNSIPESGERFNILQNVQTGSRAHPSLEWEEINFHPPVWRNVIKLSSAQGQFYRPSEILSKLGIFELAVKGSTVPNFVKFLAIK